MQDVVAIAYPTDGLSLEIASKMFFECHEIGQGLEGMVKVAELVNGWHCGMLGQFQNVVVYA
jgi:hypothetical protein